jgi:hypothetical protein
MSTERQLTLNFSPGLTAQFRSLEQVCAAAVYSTRKGLSGVAGDLDMAPTDLCRRLQEDGDRPLTAQHVDGIISSTKDYRVIYWLIEKHLQDPEAQRTSAIHQLANLMPMVQALVEQAAPPKSRSR